MIREHPDVIQENSRLRGERRLQSEERAKACSEQQAVRLSFFCRIRSGDRNENAAENRK